MRCVLLFLLFLLPLADSLFCFKGQITFSKSTENYKFSDFLNVECPMRHSCGRIIKTYDNTDLWEYGCIRKCKGRSAITCCQNDYCNSDWKDLHREAMGPEEISIVNEDSDIDNSNFGKIYVNPPSVIEVPSKEEEFKDLVMDEEEISVDNTNFYIVLASFATVAIVLLIATVVLFILTSE